MKQKVLFPLVFLSTFGLLFAFLGGLLPQQAALANEAPHQQIAEGIAVVSPPRVTGARFVQQATANNIVLNQMLIDHPLLNGDPSQIPFVTQNWNPGTIDGVYNTAEVGVWYSAFAQKWTVFNEDVSDMGEGTSFNILIPDENNLVFTVTTSLANTLSYITTLDHPALNGNPSAAVYVSLGYTGEYNTHPVGVWYDPFASRWTIFNEDLVTMPIGVTFHVLVVLQPGEHFSHTATVANSGGNTTYLDNPLINGDPTAIFYVTQYWLSPDGVYNPHGVGIWYNYSLQRWGIFNQDGTDMPEGAMFNVLIPHTGSNVQIHTAKPANTVENFTLLKAGETEGDPSGLLFITQNWNPRAAIGVYNPHETAVWYSNSRQKHSIYNEDIITMTVDAPFNVYAPMVDASVFVHTANTDNKVNNYTIIDYPFLNGNPNAMLQVTHNYGPFGKSSTYNNHATGVWYSSTREKWTIFNEDEVSAVPDSASFNVYIAPTDSHTFTQTATALNTTENYTLIDNPLTNNNPHAILLVTQYWNPQGIYNNHPIGVWYSYVDQKWGIFNQDLVNMPLGASFFVTDVTNYSISLPIGLRNFAPALFNK